MKRSFATATNAKRTKLALPDSFITTHPQNFIDGLRFMIEKEPLLASVISSSPFNQFPIITDDSKESHYRHLAKAIIGQQIHPNAANAILGRLEDQFGGFPQVEEISSASDTLLRSVGLSARKVSYLKSVCEHFIEKDLEKFLEDDNKTNDEIVERLVEIKGIGVWSAKMFLVFSLQRLDVFAEGDLGIKRGFSYFVETRKHLLEDIKGPLLVKSNKKRNWKTYSDDVMINVAENYKPYRSVFMLILWRVAAMDTSALS